MQNILPFPASRLDPRHQPGLPEWYSSHIAGRRCKSWLRGCWACVLSKERWDRPRWSHVLDLRMGTHWWLNVFPCFLVGVAVAKLYIFDQCTITACISYICIAKYVTVWLSFMQYEAYGHIKPCSTSLLSLRCFRLVITCSRSEILSVCSSVNPGFYCRQALISLDAQWL